MMARKAQSIDREGMNRFLELVDEALNEEDEIYTAKDMVHDCFDALQQIIKSKGYDRAIKLFADSNIQISPGTLRNYMSTESDRRKNEATSKSKKKKTKVAKKVSVSSEINEQSLINELQGTTLIDDSEVNIDEGLDEKLDENKVKIPTRLNRNEPELAY